MNLNGTIKKTQALSGRLVKSSGGGGSVQEIYWVQYGVGTATNAEVNEAVAANKLPICYWDSTDAYGRPRRTLYFLIRNTPTESFFSGVDYINNTIIVRRLYADAWDTQTIRYEGKLTWDTTPRFGSANPVTSGGIYNAIQNATVSDERIAEAVDDWLSVQAPSIGTLSYAAKQALLACFRHVAWIDDQGQSYYNALESELFPDATLESITAVFTQGSAVIYDTDSLDTLKQYLVVTATFSDSTTATVTDYALSGTLTAGTSTITVNYGGKTTTFSVAVTAWDISWDYTEGLPENNGFTKTYTDGTANMTSNGLECSGSSLAWTPNNEQTATTTIFETVFIPEILSSQNSANGNGFKLAVFNGSRAMTVGVNSQGVCYYDAARSGYSVATSNISTNTEYLLRIETGQSEGKIYLDGELVSTVALASTSTTNSRVFGAASARSGKTLIKAIRYDYVT